MTNTRQRGDLKSIARASAGGRTVRGSRDEFENRKWRNYSTKARKKKKKRKKEKKERKKRGEQFEMRVCARSMVELILIQPRVCLLHHLLEIEYRLGVYLKNAVQPSAVLT